jgi:hypothetical protein
MPLDMRGNGRWTGLINTVKRVHRRVEKGNITMKSVLRVILVLGGLASLMQAAWADSPDSFIRI